MLLRPRHILLLQVCIHSCPLVLVPVLFVPSGPGQISRARGSAPCRAPTYLDSAHDRASVLTVPFCLAHSNHPFNAVPESRLKVPVRHETPIQPGVFIAETPGPLPAAGALASFRGKLSLSLLEPC